VCPSRPCRPGRCPTSLRLASQRARLRATPTSARHSYGHALAAHRESPSGTASAAFPKCLRFGRPWRGPVRRSWSRRTVGRARCSPQ
jgi:hypothetical protein